MKIEESFIGMFIKENGNLISYGGLPKSGWIAGLGLNNVGEPIFIVKWAESIPVHESIDLEGETALSAIHPAHVEPLRSM